MAKTKSTLISPKLITIEDYVKQRKKNRDDFEHFVEKRNAYRTTGISNPEERQRM